MLITENSENTEKQKEKKTPQFQNSERNIKSAVYFSFFSL